MEIKGHLADSPLKLTEISSKTDGSRFKAEKKIGESLSKTFALCPQLGPIP